MTDAELVIAYADGELDAISAKRLEKRLAVEPELAAQLAAHRRLKATLANHFGPMADEPVPDSLAALIRNSAKVTDIADARASRRPAARLRWTGWNVGGSIAAALVIGLMIGHGAAPAGDVAVRGGQLVADGKLASALGNQLASTQGDKPAVRMIVSFRDGQGSYCRAFSSNAVDGIACRDADGWALRSAASGKAEATTGYRQAGTHDAALLAQAQSMMAGEPLDAGAEEKARAAGWR